MPSFAYTARDESGKAVNGVVEANSIAEAGQQLRASGKYPTAIKPATQADDTSKRSRSIGISRGGIKVSRAEVIQISQQVAIMLETGVTLMDALDCLSTQSENPKARKLLEDLKTQVQGGTDFSAALARHPRSFPRLYVALIKASERSGMMSRLLVRATGYLRDEQETLRRVKGALTYPAIMLGFAIMTTLFLLAFVLPRFTAIYASKGAALPMPTKILMGASGFVTGHWIVLLVSTVSLAAAGFIFRRTTIGSRCFDYIQLHMPLMGAMFRKLHLSRGLRMIGTMAGAGVSLVDCVATANDLCPNSYFQDLWASVSNQNQAGKQKSEPLKETALDTRSMTQMIFSAERSGKLAQVLEQISGYAETELKEKIAELTRYIEPAMIVVMGAIIGGVALALMLPIFTISKVVAN
jgi:type IV pilus assembly protein PilC